jgi:hypothetical protein
MEATVRRNVHVTVLHTIGACISYAYSLNHGAEGYITVTAVEVSAGTEETTAT